VQNSTLYYYVDSQGAAAGPVSYNDLRTLLKQGAIKPTTQICKAGDSVWAPFLPNPGDPGIPGEASTVSHPSVKLPVWWGLLLGLAVVGIFLNAILQLAQPTDAPATTWEYKTVEVPASSAEESSTRKVNLDLPELNSLGAQGWEVAGTWLEQETVHPNFGKSEYVTGLQPNVRPSRLVVLLKRQAL
jgi:hypothetical protein